METFEYMECEIAKMKLEIEELRNTVKNFISYVDEERQAYKNERQQHWKDIRDCKRIIRELRDIPIVREGEILRKEKSILDFFTPEPTNFISNEDLTTIIGLHKLNTSLISFKKFLIDNTEAQHHRTTNYRGIIGVKHKYIK
jgi:hypothetical protein